MLAASRRAPRALTPWSRQLGPKRQFLSTRTHGPVCFTVAVGKSVSKQRATGVTQAALAEFAERWHRTPSKSPNAAVILASKNLAAWLEDENFISGLLEPLRDTKSARQGPQTLDILSAAVDRAPSLRRSDQLHGEITVLHGRADTLLPGLWSTGQESMPESSSLPSLTLSRLPLGPNPPTLDVTVPLANTVFNNGRPSTMFASRCQGDNTSQFCLSHRTVMTTQTVILRRLKGNMGQIHVNLGPITRPRKIMAGLGNIVSRLEGDDPARTPMPASKELEAIIPEVLETLKESGDTTMTGPIGVWALVIPERYVAEGGDLLKPFERGWSVIHQVIASGGCLCKILSGGGGWGQKQGLLSLDPQTKYTSPDQEDVESFIKSFHGNTSPDNGSVIRPGSYIQFFVQIPRPPPGPLEIARPFVCLPSPKFTVGTQEEEEPRVPTANNEDAVSVTANLFGAVSSQGIYLASTRDAKHGDVDHPAVCTKIDAADSVIFTTSLK